MNPLWIEERAWSRASLLDSGRHFEGLQRSEESRVRIDGPRVPIDQHGTWPAAWIGGLFSYSHATLAFFEAYFSNFIEGTEFAVDVFTHHPIEFDGLHDRSETCNVGGVSVRVASIPDLIFLKRLADRPRDRDDIEKLETIARLKGKRDEPREDT